MGRIYRTEESRPHGISMTNPVLVQNRRVSIGSPESHHVRKAALRFREEATTVTVQSI
jgi:hypothetical protein